MDILSPFTNKVDVALGMISAIITYILGVHWPLFIGFLALNVIDYITGCIKSSINKKTNSKKGALGALKKLGYWAMILVAFLMSAMFIEIGKLIGVDLEITSMIGWFVLITLIINEFRSIIENFVEAGFPVPKALINGLEVANKAIDKVIDGNEDNNSDKK